MVQGCTFLSELLRSATPEGMITSGSEESGKDDSEEQEMAMLSGTFKESQILPFHAGVFLHQDFKLIHIYRDVCT